MASLPTLSVLKPKVQATCAEVQERFGIVIIGLGGSVGRGDANLHSDLDLAVRKSRRIGLYEVADATEMLTTTLGLPVDLVFVDALSSYKNKIFMRDLVLL